MPYTYAPKVQQATDAPYRLYPSLGVSELGPAKEAPVSRFQFPTKLKPLFQPMRYKVLWGGRGGTKSWGIARALLLLGANKKLRILCARELQVSISDSVHKLLSDQILSDPVLKSIYSIQKRTITNALGTEFIFAGIRNNITKIKGMEGLDIVWVEEAETISQLSWDILIPTMRKVGSEIWVSYNPDLETDPTTKRFQINPPPKSVVIKIGWEDNPWLSQELKDEKDYLYKIDPEAAAHVWGGGFRRNSATQVMRGKYVVEPFIPDVDWDGPYLGGDWGFSVDPTALVKLWIHKNHLYIEHEAYEVGCDIDDTPALFDKVPGSRKYRIVADSARPETISYMQRHGYPMVIGAIKGEGSVEDGIAFIRSFEMVHIHPRCVHAKEEAQNYSFKVDRLTKEPTTILEDKHNHIWDAVRYALENLMRQSKMGMLTYMKELAAEQQAEQSNSMIDKLKALKGE